MIQLSNAGMTMEDWSSHLIALNEFCILQNGYVHFLVDGFMFKVAPMPNACGCVENHRRVLSG